MPLKAKHWNMIQIREIEKNKFLFIIKLGIHWIKGLKLIHETKLAIKREKKTIFVEIKKKRLRM